MQKSRGTRAGAQARWLGVGLMLGAPTAGCLDWDGQLQQAGSVALALQPSSLTGSVTQPADVNGLSRVEIQRVTEDGKLTGEVTTALTQDELGHYSAELGYSGAVHLLSTGVCYAAGGSAECKLEGYAEVGPGASQANLSFVTHIAAARVRQLVADKQSLKDAVRRAERELREQLPLAGDLETLSPAQALSLEGGWTTDALAEVATARRIFEMAGERIVLADHTKLGRSAAAFITPLPPPVRRTWPRLAISSPIRRALPTSPRALGESLS